MASEPSDVSQFTLPVIVALSGVVVNLVWNFINYRKTGKIRAATIKLEQFKSLRAPADVAIGNLREDAAALRALEVSADQAPELRAKVEEVQKGVQAHYNSLETAMRGLDASQFALGGDWVTSLSTPWDNVVMCLDRAYAPHKPSSDVKTIVSQAATMLDTFLNSVQAKFEAEVSRNI